MARVLLLFGGRSAEHEVSCVSAVAIHEALEEAGHRVVPVGIDRTGAWFLADTSHRPFRATGRTVRLAVPDGTLMVGDDVIGFDVAFPVLHGPYGEDGTIQGMLEMAGKPYVGNGVLSSAVGMDKAVAKELAEAAGLRSAPWRTVRSSEVESDPEAAVRRIVDELGLPVFVKPVALGSSVGITKAVTKDRVGEALRTAFDHGDVAIVEEAIAGREIEVAVLDGGRVAPTGEIVIEGDWYDYQAKYHDATSRFVTPANLPAARAAEVQELALTAFDALRCRGLARVDFLYEPSGRGFLFNEVNTMPGFTPISGFPKMWQAAGMSYPELCNELVALAMR